MNNTIKHLANGDFTVIYQEQKRILPTQQQFDLYKDKYFIYNFETDEYLRDEQDKMKLCIFKSRSIAMNYVDEDEIVVSFDKLPMRLKLELL